MILLAFTTLWVYRLPLAASGDSPERCYAEFEEAVCMCSGCRATRDLEFARRR